MGDRLGGDVFLRQAGQARLSDSDRLGAITCPTLVVAAAQDGLRSLDEARELQAGIPGAALTVIAGSGHMLPMEAPDALAGAILPWLRTQLSGASTIGS
jgi:pimeloyl-ACP methyl ester carboxylesterase